MPRMLVVRQQIEAAFEKFGYVLYHNRLKTLALVLLFIGALASQIPNITIDMSQESLLRKDDPIRADFDAFREEFGSDGMIVIAITPLNASTPPEVFDANFLSTLKAFHEDLENEIPYLSDVTSLINARNTYGDGDMLVVEDLLEGWPEEALDLTALRETVLSNPVYVNNLISEDGRVTTVVVETEATVAQQSDDAILADFGADDSQNIADHTETAPRFLGDHEFAEIMTALQQVVDRYQSPEFTIAFSGTPVTFTVLKELMLKDMGKNIGLLIGLVAITLFLFFRRISGVVLPLLVVIFSALSTLGLMAIFDTPFTMPTQIIPQFLIAVGIGDAIHVLAIFYKAFQEGRSKEDAVAYALGHSGLAIVMTSLTTAAGLLSFSFAELAPIASMGIFCAVGVMLALLYTILLLPASLALVPVKHRQTSGPKRTGDRMDRVLSRFGTFAASHPVKILVVSAILMGVSLYYIPQIEFSHNMVSWMPEDLKTRQDVQYIDQEMKGATTVEVILDTGEENGLYEPDILHRIETLARAVAPMQDGELSVGQVFSVNDILKESNQALHENDAAYYAIPNERALIAQELLLFENSGPDELEPFVDSLFSKARFTIKTSWTDAVQYGQFVKAIETTVQETFAGTDVDVTITGLIPVMARAVPASINGAVKSYIIAILVIALMMVTIVGGLRIGLISMLPNFLPIMMVLGFMGFAGIPIDMMSILIGSIALGLVVDDTVHFIYNFRKYYQQSGDARQAMEQTFLGTGRALLTTSVVLSAGFAVAMTATMLNLQRFGLLVTMTIVLALLSDFILSPALLVLFTKRREVSQVVPQVLPIEE